MDKKNPGYLPGPICCLKLLCFCKLDPAPFHKEEIIKRIKPVVNCRLHDISNIGIDWEAKNLFEKY
ncbi:MAG: hypothetical protein ACK41Z_01370 [Sediminibacterium sp.]